MSNIATYCIRTAPPCMIHAALSTILPRSYSFASPPPSFLPPAQRSESLFLSSSSSFSDGGKKRKRKKETGKVNSVSAWSAQGKGARTRKESSIRRTTRCEIVLVVCAREKGECHGGEIGYPDTHSRFLRRLRALGLVCPPSYCEGGKRKKISDY